MYFCGRKKIQPCEPGVTPPDFAECIYEGVILYQAAGRGQEYPLFFILAEEKDPSKLLPDNMPAMVFLASIDINRINNRSRTAYDISVSTADDFLGFNE